MSWCWCRAIHAAEISAALLLPWPKRMRRLEYIHARTLVTKATAMAKERIIHSEPHKQHRRLDEVDGERSKWRKFGVAINNLRADTCTLQEVRTELLDKNDVARAVDHIPTAIVVYEHVKISRMLCGVDQSACDCERPSRRGCGRSCIALVRLSTVLIYEIPEEHVELGVWIPDQVRAIQNGAMRRLSAVYSLTLELPAATAQIGAAPDANVVVRLEPTASGAVGSALLAAVERRVCTLAILCGMHIPLATQPADSAVVSIHNFSMLR